MYEWPAILEREGDAVLVRFPDIPEAITNGYSEREALEYALDVLTVVLAEYIRRRRPLPVPSKPRRGMRMIRLPALQQSKLALYAALQESGISKAELSRRLGSHKFQTERLLDLSHYSRMDHIERALGALGKELEIAVHDAA
jgi:antitoxin HicB